ncbi:hypothetical protein [Pseudoalteromonas umbrosa]|uniref:hypothetical protein n=1 Tax=Pseudoalteromonas umbrosa TaxID=3048489 RepID=UPI0024C260E2|nr:hypothetical protein [Pseudoalteromonas sp. B95]MDK1290206.1 hypothetical protein [Pseudoalteromonas sp. B95]
MAKLENPLKMEHLRSVDFAQDHLWDAKLMDKNKNPIGRFTDWFPATSVVENLATLNNHEIEGFISTYSVPLSSSEFTIDLSFYDDVEHSITYWISDWINNGILNGGQAISTAESAKRLLQIRKFTAQHELLSDKIYWVIPDGPLDFEGHSEAGSHEYNMTFKVLGVHTSVGH